MGLILDTNDKDLHIEVRRESIYIRDNFWRKPYEAPGGTYIGPQHLWLYNGGSVTNGVVEMTKEFLAKFLDFWTPEMREKHGIPKRQSIPSQNQAPSLAVVDSLDRPTDQELQ